MLIPRDVLEIYRIASKSEEQPNLTGVHAERSPTPRLTATDGHCLLTVTWTEPPTDLPPTDFGDLRTVPGFTADLLAETCAEIARVIPKGEVGEIFRHAWLEEANINGLVRMGAGDKTLGQAVQCEAKDPEVDFPDWTAVTKSVGAAVKVGINGKLLADLLTVITKVSGERGVVLHIPSDPKAPIGLHVDNADGTLHVDAVIMPMTMDLTGRPEWEDVPILPSVDPGEPPPKPVSPQMELVPEPEPPSILIDANRACDRCGRMGATASGQTVTAGLCLGCLTKGNGDASAETPPHDATCKPPKGKPRRPAKRKNGAQPRPSA